MAIKVLIGTPANGGSSGGDMTKAVYDQANVNEQLVGLTANQSLTNKSINGVTLVNTGSNNQFLDATGNYSIPSGSGDMTKNVYDPQNIDADAFDRANHTGTQSISTVTDLQTELDDKLKQGDNILTEDTFFKIGDNLFQVKYAENETDPLFKKIGTLTINNEFLYETDSGTIIGDDKSIFKITSDSYFLQNCKISNPLSCSSFSLKNDGIIGALLSDSNGSLTSTLRVLYSTPYISVDSGSGFKFNDRSVDEANVDFLTNDDNFLSIGKAKENLALKGVLTQSGGNVTGSINTINNTFTLNASGGGGGSVNSVTGDGVDNTDPSNPVLSFPTPLEIGALKSGDNVSELINDANYVNSNQLNTKTNKALTQTLVNSTPKVISSTDSDTTFNVYGVGALCEFTINTGSLNVGEAFEINVGDTNGVDVIAGVGVNIFGLITGSTTRGDSLLVRRIPDNSFGLTGEVYKVY